MRGVSALVEDYEIHRLSIDDYHRMVASGGFAEDTHVELIDGYIVDMSPRSPQHENAIRWLIRWMFGHLDREACDLMVNGSLTIGNSEPEPDVAILRRTPPTDSHPSEALLVIEVAVSSKDRDLRTKPRVYAPAVEEYWVIDLERRVAVVHRSPGADGYAEVAVVAGDAAVEARAVDVGRVPLVELFAYAFAER
jgi:Uma2 family endonuclease